MPGVRNKILINQRTHRGMHGAFQEELESGESLAAEAQEKGLLHKLEKFKPRQKEICAALRRAEVKATNAQYALNLEMAEEIDSHLPELQEP